MIKTSNKKRQGDENLVSNNPEIETLTAIRNIVASLSVLSEMKTQRSYGAFLADRLRMAASEPDFAAWMTRLSSALQSDMTRIAKKHCVKLLTLSKEHPEVARRALAWTRANSELLAMLALSKKALAGRAMNCIDLPPARNESAGQMIIQPSFEIGIKATVLSPLSHGSDMKAGNTTLFRRTSVMLADGSIAHLPIVSGNSIRGLIRDMLADQLIESLGLKHCSYRPPIETWLFHSLYSGGSLSQAKPGSKIAKLLGGDGVVKAEGWKTFRDACPMLSLLGCAIEQHILPGRMRVGSLRPVCAEWGFEGAPSIAQLLNFEFLTRREDREFVGDDSTQMIANTETLVPGTVLVGGINMDPFATELERSALAVGLLKLAERGHIGAQAARGMGRVSLELESLPDPSLYLDFLENSRESTLQLFRDMGGFPEEEPVVQKKRKSKSEAAEMDLFEVA